MSGIELLDKMEFSYSHLIIDEACQSTEVSTLIPFMHNVQKIILVGDQNQLPATVFCDNSEKTKFNRSLYERFLDNQIPRFVLNIQYRMLPEIREFPSNQFYEGLILDAPCIKDRQINDKSGTIPSVMFYDLDYTKSSSGQKSKSNELEAEFVAKLFIEAVFLKGDGNFHRGLEVVKGEVGIITPYKKQATVIRQKIERAIRQQFDLDSRQKTASTPHGIKPQLGSKSKHGILNNNPL